MRKLLNTLYITSPGKYLALEGENVVVRENNEETARFPLHNFEEIITIGYTGCSPALMGACAERSIALCFLTPSGRFLARISGSMQGNVILRRTQYRYADDPLTTRNYAYSFLTGKIYNSRWVIERAIRDYPLRLDVNKLKEVSQGLNNCLQQLKLCATLEELRGIEGEAAKLYFSVTNDLILQQKDDFIFTDRNRRPPTDPMNAMLSFTYTLLASNCASSLETVGLDPYVGYLHRDHPGRASLAFDLMEELRSALADRFVLSLVNKRVMTKDDFIFRDNGSVLMKDESRKKFISAWQDKKNEEIKHPFLEEKVEWGLVPYVQSLLLARCIRGDIDAYPPFFWK
jgi:CRISPR-associated protein Cas1